jgi:hypothetical protein
MAVILGGKELAAVYAAGMASGVGGEEAIKRFRKLVRELSGEEPEYGDGVEFNLGRINEISGPYAPLFPLG